MRRILLFLIGVAALGLALFAWTGLDPSWRTPESGGEVPRAKRPATLRVVALNLAKLGFHRGGFAFATEEEVLTRLDAVAARLVEEKADLVFLSEVVWGGGLHPTNQVRELATRSGFDAYAYGDNYRFGLPFLAVRSGNAILSRFPLRALEVEQLAGGTPFYAPTNNRRVLWCEVELGDEALRVASIRNDSFDLANNARQARQLLASLGEREALLAGDFNAEPGDEAMRLFTDSQRFLPLDDGAPTFPAHAPTRRIDYVLAPRGWTLVERRILSGLPTDHLGVLAEFAL